MKKLVLASTAGAAALALLWLVPRGPEAALPAAVPPPPDVAVRLAPRAPPPPPAPEPIPRAALPMTPVERAASADAPATVGALAGRVRWEEDGSPAAGVTVHCRAPLDPPAGEAAATTGDDGTFALRGLAPQRYFVFTDRGGEGAAEVRPGETARVQLVVPRGCEVHGTVRVPDGQPVAGAQIWLSQRWNQESGTVVAHSDESGRFAVRSVQANRYVGARGKGLVPSPLSFVQAEPGEEVALDLVVARGDARVRGRAFAASGEPLAGALVRVSPPGRAPFLRDGARRATIAWAPAHARSGADGAFALDGLPPGTLLVQVHAPGHGVHRTELAVPAGGTGEISAVLPAAATVEGRVTGADGEPRAQAMVQAGAGDAFGMVRRWSGEDGTYRLDDVSPGRTGISVTVDGRVAVRDEIVAGPGETVVWNAVVGTQQTIAGRVVDARQQPLAGWGVQAQGSAGFSTLAVTGEDGRFALAGLPPEPHTVRASVQVASAHPLHLATIRAAEQQGVFPGGAELMLEIPDALLPSCAVRGRVVAADGTVVGQARVSIGHMDGRGNVLEKVEAATGAFAVERLVPGPYWISAHAEGFPQVRIGRRELTAGQTLDLGEIRLPHGGTLAGTLRGAPAALDAVELTVVDERGMEAGTVQRHGTRFTASPLAAGAYRLLVGGAGIARDALAFRITAGQQAALDVAVVHGVRCHVRARLPAGAAAPAWVWLTVLQGERQLGGRALDRQPDGGFAAELWLAPGRYTVWIGTDDGHDGRLDLDVETTGGRTRGEVVLAERRK